MCGIVGYVGAQEAGPILIEGLRRLEYRGYDSAGLAVIGPKGCLRVVKEPGKLAELERVLESGMPSGTCGIAHTRWATHGAPTRANAHPHWSQNGDVALVHNGIIENADALRVRRSEIGYVFETETDTEALVHLIDEAFRDNSTLEDELQLSELTGFLHRAQAPVGTQHGQASRIVPPVFETPQTLN